MHPIPPGTRDVLPDEMAELRSITERLRATLDSAGYGEVWTPLIAPPDTPDAREDRGLNVIGRLRPGVSLGAAQVQVSTIAARLAKTYPKSNLGTLQAPTAPRPMYVLRHSRLPP